MTSPNDPRIQAFLKPTNAFASIQQASSIFEYDPFDVEALHADTHRVFTGMVDRATAPSPHGQQGQMLLVLGDSGTGKTHLLREFRRHVHEYDHGLVAYAQLHSASDDYPRYLLQHVVDSLSRPYARPSGKETGLHRLARGLPMLTGEPLRSQVIQLGDEIWDGDNANLPQHIDRLVNKLILQRDLAAFDTDLLRVLLYALCPDQRIISRVYKYLRCEDMTASDRHWIGDVVPLTDRGAPGQMIRALAKLAFATQNWAFVVMLDQAELAGIETSSEDAFNRAINTLMGITNDVPSAVAVVACLSDLYYDVRMRLARSAVDRLEKAPPLQQLQLNRSYAEITAIVGTRLSCIFDEAGVVHRPGRATFPFPESGLQRLEGFRTRDVLEWCHEFQTQCALAGELVGEDVEIKHSGRDKTLDQIAAAWNDAMRASGNEVPDDDDKTVVVLTEAAKACAEENDLKVAITPEDDNAFRVRLTGTAGEVDLKIAFTNKSYRGGGFGTQISDLLKGLGSSIPVAVRTLAFPQGPASEKVMTKLRATGRYVQVDVSTLQLLVAIRRFNPPFLSEQIAAWRRRDRPISSLSVINQIFDLDRLRSISAAGPTGPITKPDARKSNEPKPSEPKKGAKTGAGDAPDVKTTAGPKPTRRKKAATGDKASPKPRGKRASTSDSQS